MHIKFKEKKFADNVKLISIKIESLYNTIQIIKGYCLYSKKNRDIRKILYILSIIEKLCENTSVNLNKSLFQYFMRKSKKFPIEFIQIDWTNIEFDD